MYRLPKEVFDILLNNSFDSLTGERVIGYLCGKEQELYDDMEYVLQHFLPGERPEEPEEAYWLYKMEEFFAGDDTEVVFQPENSDAEFVDEKTPESRNLATITVYSLEDLLAKEPGLKRYLNQQPPVLFKRPIQ